jgi:ssDNA thymidine ADP-ribosyltransferase DarT-like protein
MIASIKKEVLHRGITRLCHFTPSRNLAHIASGDEGILATKYLEEDERRVFTKTDLERLDGHKGYLCCSIEYPNSWYFDKARLKDFLFKDWVVLFVEPKYLWLPGTRFCPRNAAANYGRGILEGEKGFLALFADSVSGAGGETFTRSSTHLSCCPTDDQAEVLIPDQIAKSDIVAIGVRTKTQAKNETTRLRLMNLLIDSFQFVIAPDLFDKLALSQLIRSGKRPPETLWTPGDRP